MTPDTTSLTLSDRSDPILAPAFAAGAGASSSEYALLQAVVHAATAFLRSGEVAASLMDLLEGIGTATGASRAYVFENDPPTSGRITATQCAEWTAPGIVAHMGTPIVTNVALDADGFEQWIDAFSRGLPFVAITDSLPPGPRDRLKNAGVLSFAAAPILVNNQFWGFIGVDNCVAERSWTPVEVDALL